MTFEFLVGISLLMRVAWAGKPSGPSWQSGRFVVVPYLAQFDEANAGLVNGVPVRGVTPLGPYDNLYYSNLGVISDNTAIAGVPAHSLPNALGYDIVAEMQGQQRIHADYDNSITDHFALHSFYFGCVVDTQETMSSSPVACNVTVTGYLAGTLVGSQSVSFSPKVGASTAEMVKVNLDLVSKMPFANVDAVTFDSEGVLQKISAAVLFDDFVYDVYLKPGYHS